MVPCVQCHEQLNGNVTDGLDDTGVEHPIDDSSSLPPVRADGLVSDHHPSMPRPFVLKGGGQAASVISTGDHPAADAIPPQQAASATGSSTTGDPHRRSAASARLLTHAPPPFPPHHHHHTLHVQHTQTHPHLCVQLHTTWGPTICTAACHLGCPLPPSTP
jgi:hypothetical protein